jgi:GT2 family glycosyltransferase
MSPRISIVIPAYDGAALTQRCLDTLIGQELEAEIVVVDDASTDETSLVLATYGDKITVLRNDTNLGYAGSCNRGVAHSSGEIVVLLNNDTEPLDGWLESLVGYLDARPAVGIVGCKLLYPDGRIQHAGVAFGASGYPYHLYNGFPGDHPATNRSRRFQVVTAACMVLTRALFDRLGGFDEGFVNSAEDVDLCLRAGELGHEVHYCAEARVVHLESATRGRHLQRQSELLYEQRWADRVRHDELDFLLDDGLLEVAHGYDARLLLDIDPLVGRVRDADPLAAERVIDDVTARWLASETARDRLAAEVRRRDAVEVRFDATGAVRAVERAPRWTDGALDQAWARYDFLRRKCEPLRLRVRASTPPRVNVLFEGLSTDILFAGHAAVLQLAAALAETGRHVRVLGLDQPADGGRPLAMAARELDGGAGLLNVEYQDACDRDEPVSVSPDDRFVATSWWTMRVAHAAAEQLAVPAPLWMVQEYEPLFYPAGSFSAMARATYDLPHAALISTELLRDHLRAAGVGALAHGWPVGVFRNPLTTVRSPSADDLDRPPPRRILLYLRNAPRNLAEIVLAGVDLASRRGDLPSSWHVTGVGGDLTGSQHIELPSGCTVETFDRLTPARYRAMLRSHDIGVALQDTPHPGLVALDMAGAGLTAITSEFEGKTASVLRTISPNVVGVAPEPDAIAAAVAAAVSGVRDYELRASGAAFDWPRTAAEAYSPAVVDGVARLIDGEAGDRVSQSAEGVAGGGH